MDPDHDCLSGVVSALRRLAGSKQFVVTDEAHGNDTNFYYCFIITWDIAIYRSIIAKFLYHVSLVLKVTHEDDPVEFRHDVWYKTTS